MDTRNAVSRRTFVAGLGLGLGGLGMTALAGCASETPASGSNSNGNDSSDAVSWDEEFDVVVLGAGGAGLAAAITAVEHGASAVIVEIMNSYKASGTSLSGGVLMAWGTPLQEEQGFEGDSAEEFIKYVDAQTSGWVDDAVIHKWATESHDTYFWLTDMGVVFQPEKLYFSGNEQQQADITKPMKRGHIAIGDIGSGITDYMNQKAEDLGVVFAYETQALSLIQDQANRVVGVETTKGTYKARKGVVVATAGYTRNQEFLRNVAPELRNAGSFGSAHQQGDGIVMAGKIGAAAYGMGLVQAKANGFLLSSNAPGRYMNMFKDPDIIVSQEGVRVIAEDSFYEDISNLIGNQPGQYLWDIWDQHTVDLDNLSMTPIDLDAEVEKGAMCRADTIEELATQMGIDPATLKATYERHTQMAQNGVDDDFGRPSDRGFVPLTTPPFYAVKLIISLADTAGGLPITTEAEVLDWNGEPIEGLYAAGSTTWGWRGRTYVGSGTAVCYAITSGRWAGASAAAAESIA